jgi:hypothetical protein
MTARRSSSAPATTGRSWRPGSPPKVGPHRGRAIICDRGVAEANALAAESIAIERGIGHEEIAQTEALVACGGVQRDARPGVSPDRPRDGDRHGTRRGRARSTRPTTTCCWTPRGRPDSGLAQLLRFRGACATADSAAEREAATACLLNAEAELTKAAEALSGLLELAKVSAAAGRTATFEAN